MSKPPAPDTLSVHLPEPTGRDAHDSPYWRIGPVLISVGVITSGPDTGRHGVFVDSFEATPAGTATALAAAVSAAGRAAAAADARAAAAHTRAEQVEEIARAETPGDLLRILHAAEESGDYESADLFRDALAWQTDHAEVTTS